MSRARLLWATLLLGALALPVGSDAHSQLAGPVQAPLGVVSVATPRFPVARFQTDGTYPEVRNGKVALGAVNLALRDAIVADQRAFEPYARRYAARVAGRRLPSGYAGYYETELDRTTFSASTVVVSVLMPRTRTVLPMQARARAAGWLGITIRVPSGKPVVLSELFARRAEAMSVLEAHVRADRRLDESIRQHPAAALANAQFAVLPIGLVVGFAEVAYQDYVLVQYRALRPYLSSLGIELTAGARWPDFRPDKEHLSYCRRPGLSWSQLSATGDVPCSTARTVESDVFSPRCVKRNRCVASGFTCLAFWDGRYDQPFYYTHHAICHDGKRRIEMDEG